MEVESLPKDWSLAKLGDAADFINGDRGQNYPTQADRVQSGVPFINTGHIEPNGRLTNIGMDYITRESFDLLRNGKVASGDILYCLRGSTIGKTARNHFAEGAIASSLVIVRAKPNACQEYLFFYLTSPFGRDLVTQHDNGSAQPNLSVRALSNYPFPLPPLPEQRAIAHILGTLDDKIELNRRRNQTLEAMARALFKDWFVDFGPVHAKMEAREPYLPADLWQRFPDRLDDEGKPEGWRRSMIGSEVTVCGGSTPSTKESTFWKGGKHHWATPKDLSALTFPVLLDTDRKITDAGIAKISSGLLPVGTVLLSSRAPIGYLAIAEVPTAINQGFIAMKCDGTLPNLFVLFWCRENMDLILGNANGSTFQEISKRNFRPILVIVPPEPILKVFRERTEPLYRHIVENERESTALAQLRDTLLPKLITGELRIKDVEKFMERVA